MTKEEAQLEATVKLKRATDLINDAKLLAIQNQLELTFEFGDNAESYYDDGPFVFKIDCDCSFPDTDWRPGGWVGSSYNC